MSGRAGGDWAALRAWCREQACLPLSTAQLDQLSAYVNLLLFWSRRLALVSQRDPVAILTKHVADSLFVAARCTDEGRLADLGSGAGFPGLPIAIARPGVAVTLIESRAKKATFLGEARRTARTPNVTVLNDRIEAVARQPAHGRGYSVVTARALATAEGVIDLGLPLLAPGGRLIAMRTREPAPPPRHRMSLELVDYQLPDGTPRRLMIFTAPESRR